MSVFDFPIFETSDTETLVKYIRQKRGIIYAQRIFDVSPANGEAERSFPIEIQTTQENAKAVTPLKQSEVEVGTCSNSRIPRINLKRISTQRESIGKRNVLRNLAKASGSGENFEPTAFSTLNSVVINEDLNISGISTIPLQEEVPETQEPNEVPVDDHSQKTTENDNHQTIVDAGIQYAVEPPAIVHQQEETLKKNNQVDEANDNVTLVNNRVVQQNVLVKSSDSHTRSSISEDGEGNLAQNQNTKKKYRTRMSTRVGPSNTEQINIKSSNQLNSSSLRIKSNENVKETIQQAVFEEPSYSNLIKLANDLKKEDQILNKKNTNRTASNIGYNSRRSRVESQNLTKSVQVPYTKEIVQTNQHIAVGGSAHSDSSSEDDYEHPVPEKNLREYKNSENKSTGQSSSNRNLNSRKNGVKSFDFPAGSIQTITSDQSNSILEENCQNSKENQNPTEIKGRKLFRNDPNSRRSNRLLHKVPISNKKTEADQQITSESPSESKKYFPKENEISKKSTGHTSPRIEQNSKNVVSMVRREKAMMPITQNFHKETEREKRTCDKEKKCKNAIDKVLTTKDVGCQKENFELLTSDEEVENIFLTPRKHNMKNQNKKMILRKRNNTDKPETNMTDICDVNFRALHFRSESSNIKTVENVNDKVLTGSSMRKKGENSMNKVSQTHNSTQIVHKGKKRLSQMDPIKQEYLNIRNKLRKNKMENVNVSRRKSYSKGDSDQESSKSSDTSAKLSQETPVILHSKKETRKRLNFSSNLDEKVSNEARLVKSNNREESRYNDCNSSDLPVEPSEVDDQPTRSVEFSRPSVVESKNNRKTDKTKDRSAEQSEDNKKTKYSDGSKSKPMESSHPPSEELNGLRRSSRQRKSPVIYWSCRYFKLSRKDLQETFSINNKNKISRVENKKNTENLKSIVTKNNVTSKDAADRVAINENQIADEFYRLKESIFAKNSKKRKKPKNDENNVMKKPIQLSKNSSKKDSECNENPPDRLFSSWLKNLATPRFVARCKDIMQISHSDSFEIGKVEDLKFHEVNGVEYACYFGENNNYGYIKFHPHSQKPNARTKTAELKFLSLVGNLQINVDEDLRTIKNGDLITIPKGGRYGILNPSNDPAVLFFIRV